MISCFLIGKDTSVCVRFFTADEKAIKPWILAFDRGPCHVHLHCKTDLDYPNGEAKCEEELIAWLASSSCVSAVLLLDSRMVQVNEPSFLKLCLKAKSKGVFIGLFVDGDKKVSSGIESLQPNWKLPIVATADFIQQKVNEILGVARLTEFKTDL